jgi:hypothetical protein
MYQCNTHTHTHRYIYINKDKGKVHPITGHEGPEGSTLSLTSALDGVGGQRHALAALPRERLGTHCIGGSVGPRAVLDGCEKSPPPLGFDPRTVQPVDSRYTVCAIPASPHPIYIYTVNKVNECISLYFTGTY